MRIMFRVVAGTAAALLSFSLAACGGGGGGSSVPSGGSGSAVTPTPVPTTTAAAAAQLTHAQQRATMQTSMTAVQSASTGGTAGALSVARHALSLHRGRRISSTATCVNGETSVEVQSETSITETDTYFYDSLCTQIEEADVVSLPVTSSETNFTATGTITDYATTGGVTSYETLTIAFDESSSTQATITLQAAQAASVGGPTIALSGTTCSETEGTSLTVACGAADVLTLSGAQTGASLQESGAVAASSASFTITASAYSAPSGLGIAQGISPAWSVTGGSPIDTISGAISVATSGTTFGSATISLSDASTGIFITGALAGGNLTMTEVQNGKTLVTAVVNAAGNGTITYADGTTSTIVDWTIEG